MPSALLVFQLCKMQMRKIKCIHSTIYSTVMFLCCLLAVRQHLWPVVPRGRLTVLILCFRPLYVCIGVGCLSLLSSHCLCLLFNHCLCLLSSRPTACNDGAGPAVVLFGCSGPFPARTMSSYACPVF